MRWTVLRATSNSSAISAVVGHVGHVGRIRYSGKAGHRGRCRPHLVVPQQWNVFRSAASDS